MWVSWTYVADPGTHADEENTALRIVSLLIAVGGIVLFSILTAFVVEYVRLKLEDLREGRSRVVERDHHLIIGWTDKATAVVEELLMAMESEGGGTIVILCEQYV